MAWYSLTGPNPTNPNDYTFQSSQPSCPGSEEICAIQANASGANKPVITQALLEEMVDALHNGAATANVKLKDRA